MNKQFTRFIVALMTGILILGSASTAMAQTRKKEEPKETKETVAMSQQVYEKLVEIQEMIEAKDYASAERLTVELRAKKNLSDYELAQIWNISAYSYYLQERYTDAINAYDQVLAQEGLPLALQQSTLKTKSQLMFTQEDYEGALVVIRELLSIIPEPSADVLMIEGQALFQLARYEEALVPIRTAIDMYRDQGQKPKENWLLLLRVIYFEMKDYDNMLLVVKELVAYYPKDTYILVLAGIYSELGDTKKQLALVEVLYEKGILNNASQITNLANLYLLHGLPYKSAMVLDREIEAGLVESNERNLRLLSQAWYTAREDQRAIPPLERAADMAEDGELYIRLAQSHINLEQWSDAAAAAREGIRLGGLKRSDQAQIMLGMALFNQKLLEQSRTAFVAASKDRRSSKAAGQWINYVDSEIKRRDLMRQELPNYQPRERDDLLDVIEGNTGGQ
jgi:tetratricopeptide (TPR) repeat protein